VINLSLHNLLGVSVTTIYKSTTAVSTVSSTRCVLHTTISDGSVVGCNFRCFLQLLLNKSKGVHGIPPVGFLGRSFGGLRLSYMGDERFRSATYLQLVRVERMETFVS